MMRTVPLLLLILLCSACASERVLLLPGADGSSGAVAVLAEDGSERGLVDQPYTTATLGGASVKPARVSAEKVQRDYGGLLGQLPPAPKVFVLYFHEGTTELVSGSIEDLAALFAEVASRSGAEVQVTGHTDRVGSVSDNDALSASRARSVRMMLVARGLEPELVIAVGRGEREPLVATADEQAEPRNRRVEVTVR